MKRSALFQLLALLTVALSACQNEGAPPVSVSPPALPDGAKISLVSPTPAALAAQQGAVATSVDERGVPRFLLGTVQQRDSSLVKATAEEAARLHLTRFLPAQRVTAEALSAARVVDVRELEGNARLVHLRQELNDIEVYPSDVKVLLKHDNELVAISGALKSTHIDRAGFRLSVGQAVTQAIGDRLGVTVPASAVRDSMQRHAKWDIVSIDGQEAVTFPEPAHVKRVYYPQGERLTPAFVVEFTASMPGAGASSEMYRTIVAATDGQVLARAKLTASAAFTYRVYAEATGDGRPFDGPTVDYTPHPTSTPNGARPAFAAPNLVSMEGFNRNPSGATDPWLADSATETVGNNVDAYGDLLLPDGYTNGDLRATLTGVTTFDRTYDLNASPLNGNQANAAQLMASTTNAFYVANWMHDYWYNAGFDERAGNNQFDNMDRGGFGGDRMKIEVQDRALAGQKNNANMSTPADGFPPRMQIFVWNGYSSRDLRTSLSADALVTNTAAFGPNNFSLTGALALADDGSATVTDACQPLVNNVVGAIVLADRGACTFKTKALNIQNAGAVGMILANNTGTTAPALGDDATITTAITIGTLSVSLPDGTALKTGLTNGAVNVTSFSLLTAPDADGSLDNTTIAHEYGHFWHHRLQDCNTAQCGGQSEGWGDFLALHLMLRDGDDLDGTFSDSTYVSLGLSTDGAYFGIRRYPYSTDLTKNPLTFAYVADQGATFPNTIPLNPSVPTLSEVHNAGEVWAVTVFDAYVALQKARVAPDTFDDVRLRFARDLTIALQVAPRDSTYTEMRDAILATISARSTTDRDLVAQAFARRGMGTCAVSPARDGQEGAMTGLVESTALSPSISLGAITLNDATQSCDSDGLLDAEETGVLTLQISNSGPQTAAGTTVLVASTTAGVTVSNGGTVNVPDIAAYSSQTVTVPVALAADVTLPTTATFDVTVNNAASCTTELTAQLVTRLNTDEQANSSTTDAVEAQASSWTLSGDFAEFVWAREIEAAPNHVWHGYDVGAMTDTSLVSPELQVSATEPFAVTFSHIFSFEFGDDGNGNMVAWDGAVIEVSEEGGPWRDVTEFGATPGYGGVLFSAGNPLGTTRQVYQHQNPAYPGADAVTLDFGTQFASKRVKLRFRIGTDAAAGDFGWQIDDIAFTGITNTPFTQVVADTHHCQRSPVANAGSNQSASRGAQVVLDASTSSDPDGDALTFTWAQTAGPTVTLVTTSGAVTGFVAPALAADTVLTFAVTVSDGTRTATDSVDVTVSGNRAPVANAGSALNVASGAMAVLNGSASTDPDGDTLTATWSQTDGPMATLGGASTIVTTFTAPAVTTDTMLTFRLQVSDGTATATADVTVTVVAGPANGAPVVMATGPDSVQSGASDVLDASASTDPEGDMLTFSWVQTDGPMAVIANASRAITTFTAPSVTADATLTFAVTASDGALSQTAMVTVTVHANKAPVAVAGSDVTVTSGEAVLLRGNSSSDPELGRLTYSWKQTSGTPSVTLEEATASVSGFTAPAVTTETTLTFELKVTDAAGLSSTDTVSVTVQPPPKAGCSVVGGNELGLLALGAALWLRRRR